MSALRVVPLALALWAGAAVAQSTGLQDFLEAAEQGNLANQVSVQQRAKAAADFRVAWSSLLPALTASAGWTRNQYSAELTFPDSANPRQCSSDADCDEGQVCSEQKSFNPLTGGTISYSLCSNRTVIQPLNQLDAMLRVDLPIIDTSRWVRIAAASTAETSAEQRALATRDQVRRGVVGAYYGYAAALAVRASALKSTGVAEAQLKLMEIRSSAGAVTELDLLRARAEVQRNRQLVADTEALVATAGRALHTLSGLAPPAALELPPADVRPEGDLGELEARVPELAAVRAAETDVKLAGQAATASRLGWLPGLNGHFTQRFSNATGFAGEGAVYSLGLNLTWRLDAPTFMNIGAQEANERMARLALENTRLQARDQVHSDWQRLKASLTKIEAAAAQVQAAARAAQVAKDRYAAGAGTQVDVIQAERDLFSAEVGQIQARTELASARASLRISSGLPVE